MAAYCFDAINEKSSKIQAIKNIHATNSDKWGLVNYELVDW